MPDISSVSEDFTATDFAGDAKVSGQILPYILGMDVFPILLVLFRCVLPSPLLWA